jgi:hypothetical protein
MRTLFYYLPLLLLAFCGCEHTNNLAKYDLSQKYIYFDEYVEPDATKVEIAFEKEKSNKDSSSAVKDIIEGIGASVVTAEVEKKMMSAANPDSVVYNMSEEFAEGLIKLLKIIPSRILDDRSIYVCTATLKECKVTSSAAGIYIYIRASFRILERGTGNIVWENSETKSTPVRRQINIQSSEASTSIKNIAQLAELSALTEEQLRKLFNQSAREVARMMFETFREDLNEAGPSENTKKM